MFIVDVIANLNKKANFFSVHFKRSSNSLNKTGMFMRARFHRHQCECFNFHSMLQIRIWKQRKNTQKQAEKNLNGERALFNSISIVSNCKAFKTDLTRERERVSYSSSTGKQFCQLNLIFVLNTAALKLIIFFGQCELTTTVCTLENELKSEGFMSASHPFQCGHFSNSVLTVW